MEVAAARQKLHRPVCFTVPIEFYSIAYCTYFRAQEGIQMYGVVWTYGRHLNIWGIQMPPKSDTPMPASKVGYPL